MIARRAGVSIAAGLGTRYHAAYSAGGNSSVRTVAMSKPPIIANAIGPQNTSLAIGIRPQDRRGRGQQNRP